MSVPESRDVPRWGARPVRRPNDPSSNAREFLLEVEGKTVGRLTVRTFYRTLIIEELFLTPEWRSRGIEEDCRERLEEWAREHGKRVSSSASSEVGERTADFGSGLTWLTGDASPLAYVTCFLVSQLLCWSGFSLLGAFERVGLSAGDSWIDLDAMKVPLTLFLVLFVSTAAPLILADLSGRLLGGRRLVRLPRRFHGWWWIGVIVTLVLLDVLLGFVGWDLRGGGYFTRIMLVPLAGFLYLLLRPPEVREGGILLPGLPAYVPFDAVASHRIEGDRIGLDLRRPLIGVMPRLLRFRLPPDRVVEIEEILAARTIPGPGIRKRDQDLA